MREVTFRHGGDSVSVKLTETSETARTIGFSEGDATSTITLTAVSSDNSTVVEYATSGVPADKVDATREKIGAVLTSLKEVATAPAAPGAAGAAGGAGGAGELEWPADRVRQTFVDYFVEKQGHVNVVSSPVVPHSDPTLLFTNAGMNQFKPIFLGQVDPMGPHAGLKRAANSQKCIRAGGKHNDLDDVGKDVYHHTFFEMLGNWSFGDYFKREAIDWAWDLLVNVYGLEPERLYATYFGGGDGLEPDNEARDMWRDYLPDGRILPFDKKDNFWEMGDVGPCGPCTEIHYDRIGGRDAASLVNMDDPDVLEIWNLVFMQFNRLADGSLRPLADKHIDTGMGFERVTSVLQNKRSNYDTDVFAPLFAKIQEVCHAPDYQGRIGDADADKVDTAYRVLADHARTLTYAITDGARPSNEGRGYVLRRVLRRAVRYGQQVLGAEKGFFSKIVPTVAECYGHAFPELREKIDFVVEVVLDEEMAFNKTLDRGVREFNRIAESLPAGGTVSGADCFMLYDRLGFPVDLTEIMADEHEKRLRVDMAGFNAELEAARTRSREARKNRKGAPVQLFLEGEQTKFLAESGAAPTDDSDKYDWDSVTAATVQAVYTPEGFVKTGKIGSDRPVVGLVLDRTNFYSESGGQVYDTGRIVIGGGASGAGGAGGSDADGDGDADLTAIFDVESTQVFGAYVLHIGSVSKGEIGVGDAVTCQVDITRRGFIAPNHTMTHVLNFALRTVLGPDVDQKGSSVEEDKLRFDFNHGKGMTPDELDEVERIVNEQIERALPVHSKVVPLADARRIHSLRAVFGETYPDPVRVVAVGESVEKLVADPDNAEWGGLSVELCGGTHLRNSSQAHRFHIVEESSIAKGIRRVVAVTREEALAAYENGQELVDRLSIAKSMHYPELEKECRDLNVALGGTTMPAGLKARLFAEHRTLEKRMIKEKKAAQAALEGPATEGIVAAWAAAKEAGRNFVVVDFNVGQDSKVAKKVVACVCKAAPDATFMAFDAGESTCIVYAACGPEARGPLPAGDWIKAVASHIDGRGGGKPNTAQASGKNPAGVDAAKAAAEAFAASKLS